MQPQSTFHDAFRKTQDSQVETLIKRTKAEEKDSFHWKDPLRDFESMGQFVAVELRYWTQMPLKDRERYLAEMEDRYTNRMKSGEDPLAFQKRMRMAWRDVAFIVGEELKTFVRPELAGRGSPEIIARALTMIVRPPEQPIEKKKK